MCGTVNGDPFTIDVRTRVG